MVPRLEPSHDSTAGVYHARVEVHIWRVPLSTRNEDTPTGVHKDRGGTDIDLSKKRTTEQTPQENRAPQRLSAGDTC